MPEGSASGRSDGQSFKRNTGCTSLWWHLRGPIRRIEAERRTPRISFDVSSVRQPHSLSGAVERRRCRSFTGWLELWTSGNLQGPAVYWEGNTLEEFDIVMLEVSIVRACGEIGVSQAELDEPLMPELYWLNRGCQLRWWYMGSSYICVSIYCKLLSYVCTT